ncbi:hypothetical protein V1504DRAFT_491551 [Lipomyces starkeyi]
MTDRTDLLEIVRRPLLPDVRLEVQVSWEQYKRVQKILENEGLKYPRLWYDGTRNIAIVVAPQSALQWQPGLRSEISNRVDQWAEMGNTRGRTTRGWNGSILYSDGNRDTLMIAVEESLRAAISWSVCALHCRLGMAMCIREQSRGETPDPPQYSSIHEEYAAIDELKRISRMVLETYRAHDENLPYGTVLDPSRSFAILRES